MKAFHFNCIAAFAFFYSGALRFGTDSNQCGEQNVTSFLYRVGICDPKWALEFLGMVKSRKDFRLKSGDLVGSLLLTPQRNFRSLLRPACTLRVNFQREWRTRNVATVRSGTDLDWLAFWAQVGIAHVVINCESDFCCLQFVSLRWTTYKTTQVDQFEALGANYQWSATIVKSDKCTVL